MSQPILILFSLLTAQVNAEPIACARGITPHGHAVESVAAFDRLVQRTPAGDQVRALNEFLAKSGLPISVSIGEKIRGIADYVEADDGPGGASGELFLKTLRLPRGASAGFDKIYEVGSPSSKNAVHVWNLPYNSGLPVAVSNDEVVFPVTFAPLCAESSNRIDVALAIRPDGHYRIIAAPAQGSLPIKLMDRAVPCPAAGIFFKGSDYSACGQTPSPKQRTFVFATPMT